MFRHVLSDGLARSINDNGDGGIVTAILEHWYRVLTFQVADWRTPLWFWPTPHPLSLTDSLFLLSLPYSAARALGVGWFAALDLTVLLLASVGFWGFVTLARRCGATLAISAVFGFIFTFGVVPQMKLFHVQTYTMQLAPLLGLMLLAAFAGSRQAALGWSVASGLLIGAMFFTAAQTPWFLGLEVGLGLLIAGLFNFRSLFRLPRAAVLRAALVVAGFTGGMIVGLIPFALLYRESVGLQRSWLEVLVLSPYPLDLFNIPSGDIIWSGLLERLRIAGQPRRNEAEVALGWTPVLAACAGLGFLLFGRIRRAAGPAAWDPAVRPLLAAAVLGPIVSLHFRWFDLWYAIYRYVPGGSSVRTPYRIALAAALLLCLGLALVATRLWAAVGHRRRRLWPSVGLIALLVFLLAEQLGAGPTTRDAAAMRRWMEAAGPPPAPCVGFYLVPNDSYNWQDYQSDGMILAEITGTPTVNGNASFLPPEWDLRFSASPAYAERVLTWLDAHGLRERVCGIAPQSGKWIVGVQPLLDGIVRAAAP